MKPEVQVTITGEHCIEGQWQEPVVTVAKGKYIFRNEAHYLQYSEQDADTGAGIRSVVRFTQEMLRVSRKGALGSELEFIPGKRTLGVYTTGAGTVSMEMQTEKLLLSLEEDAMEITAEYILMAGDSQMQRSRVRIRILPL